MLRHSLSKLALAAGLALGGAAAHADLDPAAVFTGEVGLSVDGLGSTASATGNIQAFIPLGATVLRAFLYAPTVNGANFTTGTFNAAGITLGGFAVANFNAIVGIPGYSTGRADVTALVQALAGGGSASQYQFAVTEGTRSSSIDGIVLAIVYQLAGLPQASIALLDGGQAQGGETTTVNFASPITDPSSPSFVAQLGLGISFSAGGQQSNVDVNGQALTRFAGDNDDGAPQNGALITVGGLGDNPLNNVADYADDDELYTLTPFLRTGDTQFTIRTDNPSSDDNIFFASLYVTAQFRDVNDVPVIPSIPEPETYALMLAGLGLLGAAAKRRKAKRAA